MLARSGLVLEVRDKLANKEIRLLAQIRSFCLSISVTEGFYAIVERKEVVCSGSLFSFRILSGLVWF